MYSRNYAYDEMLNMNYLCAGVEEKVRQKYCLLQHLVAARKNEAIEPGAEDSRRGLFFSIWHSENE